MAKEYKIVEIDTQTASRKIIGEVPVTLGASNKNFCPFSTIISKSTVATWTKAGSQLFTLPDNATVKFRCILQVEGAWTVEAQVYDYTAGAYVAGTLLSSTSTTPEIKVSADITIPAGARTLEIHFRRQSGTDGDAVYVDYADIEVTHG